MLTDQPKPTALPRIDVLPAKAPRGSEEEPWDHPADGGAPIGGGDFWRHDDAFGTFQSSEEFPDDLANAIRKVYEKMYRSGFRDWESEWDYVECSYWFMRRHLEVNAREAFRIWYGDEKWQEPFRLSCVLQEAGKVEYRIDHLLSSLGIEVRKLGKPVELFKPQKWPKKDAILRHYREALREGPMTSGELARKVSESSGVPVSDMDVRYNLVKPGLVRWSWGRSRSGRSAQLLSLP